MTVPTLEDIVCALKIGLLLVQTLTHLGGHIFGSAVSVDLCEKLLERLQVIKEHFEDCLFEVWASPDHASDKFILRSKRLSCYASLSEKLSG